MRFWLLTFLVAVLGSPATAQGLPELLPSSTIKIWAPSTALESERATFVEWQSSHLLAVRETSSDTLQLDFADITRLDLLDGKSLGRGILGGASIGGLLGGLIGYLVGANATSDCNELFCELGVLGYTTYGAGIGIVVGGGAGWLAAPDRWVRQTLPPEMGFPPRSD